MTRVTFNLPDLGEGLHEAEIVAWHVTPGDNCVIDQPLISLETDKAVVEVPAPHSGSIVRLFGEPGDRIQVGEPLVEFDEGVRSDSGALVGEIINAPKEKSDRPERSVAVAAGSSRAAQLANSPKIKASPAVRAYAWERGVDLAGIRATGKEGTISRSDVDRALDDPGTADTDPEMPGEYPAARELRGTRRAMAERMSLAHAEVVPATVTDEVDVHDWPVGTSVTIRLVLAIALAAKASPALNAWYDGKAQTLRLMDIVDLGIAADTPEGLFVPVLRNIGNRDDGDLAAGFNRLKQAVMDRRIPPHEMQGQTITLSNYGMIAGRHSAMVVVPPQVAIVGAGRIEERVVARNGGIAVRRILPLSLTFDHRAVTGGEAARFLRAMMDTLTNPE